MVNAILKDRLTSIIRNLAEIKKSKFYFYQDEENNGKYFTAAFKNFADTLGLELQYDINRDKFSIMQFISKKLKDESANDNEGATLEYLLKNKELHECETFIKELIENNNNTFHDKNNKIIINNFCQNRNYDEKNELDWLNTRQSIDKMINNIKCTIDSSLYFSMDRDIEDRLIDAYKKTGLFMFDYAFRVSSKKQTDYNDSPAITMYINNFSVFNVYISRFNDLDEEDKVDINFDNYEDTYKRIKMLNEKYLKGTENYLELL